MARYKVFTAQEALAMARNGYTDDELAEALEREHERIRKAASEGRRCCWADMPWLARSDNALASEVRGILEKVEGYRISEERDYIGGVLQDPYPRIRW